MKEIRVLVNRKKDNSEFEVQIYEELHDVLIKKGGLVKMSAKDIINDIDINKNDIYVTKTKGSLLGEDLTKVEVDGKLIEGIIYKKDNRYLSSVPNNTKKDNINELPYYI